MGTFSIFRKNEFFVLDVPLGRSEQVIAKFGIKQELTGH